MKKSQLNTLYIVLGVAVLAAVVYFLLRNKEKKVVPASTVRSVAPLLLKGPAESNYPKVKPKFAEQDIRPDVSTVKIPARGGALPAPSQEYWAYTCPTGILTMGKNLVTPPEGASRREVMDCIFNYVKKYIPGIIRDLGLQGTVCDALAEGKAAAERFATEHVDSVLDSIFDKVGIRVLASAVKPLVRNIVVDEIASFLEKNHAKLAGPSPGLACPTPAAPEDEWA